NSNLSAEARYAILVHELAHLYCGHLGTPNDKWWPDRRGLPHVAREFEAESVCFLVCERLGIAGRWKPMGLIGPPRSETDILSKKVAAESHLIHRLRFPAERLAPVIQT